ncbi:hypothetical protein EV210_12517 [Anaerospora hongkongensis]|uniref:Uncharacterized protein n=1 Tax=Anaerospora hongkongensis TaxID=244830 RepID=A0A4R1PW87_9FIRM|nr:hypothetical protein [Anaerospora hongkongensis]TCL31975.1 hypothetical protein EV210_12517 [Anaerospora hongkongensis]
MRLTRKQNEAKAQSEVSRMEQAEQFVIEFIGKKPSESKKANHIYTKLLAAKDFEATKKWFLANKAEDWNQEKRYRN